MIKKKYFLLLSTFLLTLFLGLCGKCYAREITLTELKNVICNYAVYYYGQNYDINSLRQSLDSNETFLNSIVSSARNSQDRYFITCTSGKIYYGIYDGTASNLTNHPVYSIDTYIAINNSYLTGWCKVINVYNASNVQYTDWTSWTRIYMNNFNNSTYYLYTDGNIRTSSSSNASIRFASGYYTPDTFFDENYYQDSYFEFIINNDAFTGTAKIYGDTSNTDYYLLPYNAYSVRLGFLYDSNNLDNIVKRKYRYNQANRDFELIKEYVSNINDSNFYVSGDGYLNVYEYYQPDTTEFIIFTAKDSSFNQIVLPIYYTTKNTNIVGGYINLDNTFSGDYYNNYNNDTNTDKIIENINNDDDVDSTLNEFISGDAEQIANKFGFTLFTMEYYDFIYHTVTEIVDVLTESGDVYFDYSMHGETPTRIYSSSFTTPNGALKTFLQMFLISCTVYAFYKYIADLLELISTGNILEALNEFAVDRNIFKM